MPLGEGLGVTPLVSGKVGVEEADDVLAYGLTGRHWRSHGCVCQDASGLICFASFRKLKRALRFSGYAVPVIKILNYSQRGRNRALKQVFRTSLPCSLSQPLPQGPPQRKGQKEASGTLMQCHLWLIVLMAGART